MDSIFDGQTSRTWHIYWQAAVGRDLLVGSSLANRIRSRLLEAHRKPERKLLFYLLTQSEIHLITALAGRESPSALARGVANVVARWVRDADGIRGPVFANRYQARQIESIEELRREVRMLAWRPVSMRLCVVPTHHAHSALRIALGLSRLDGFRPNALLGLFGASIVEARAALRMLVRMRPSELESLQWELERGVARAPGACGPMGTISRRVRGVAAVLVAASESKSIDGALELLEGWVLIKLQMRAGQDLASRKEHVAARARALVAILAMRSGLCSAAAVARHFHRAKATLSEQMASSLKRPADQTILSLPMDQIVQESVELALRGRSASAS